MAKRTPSEVVLSPYLICRQCRCGKAPQFPPCGRSWVELGDPTPLGGFCSTHLAQHMHCNAWGFNVTQVTLCIIFEVVGDTEPGGRGVAWSGAACTPPAPRPTHSRCRHSPQGLLPATQVVLHNDASHCATLAHTSPVANEEACTLPAGQQDLVLLP